MCRALRDFKLYFKEILGAGALTVVYILSSLGVGDGGGLYFVARANSPLEGWTATLDGVDGILNIVFSPLPPVSLAGEGGDEVDGCGQNSQFTIHHS